MPDIYYETLSIVLGIHFDDHDFDDAFWWETHCIEYPFAMDADDTKHLVRFIEYLEQNGYLIKEDQSQPDYPVWSAESTVLTYDDLEVLASAFDAEYGTDIALMMPPAPHCDGYYELTFKLAPDPVKIWKKRKEHLLCDR